MKVFGVTGWKNSGKTTLVAKLVRTLTDRGYRVSTIKHAHHRCDVDQPGRDSYLHREAGAAQVLLASSQRWALMTELRGAEEPSLEQLLSHLEPVDIVIVEGFKLAGQPKLQVIRADNNRDRLPDSIDNLVAIASDDHQLDPADYGCKGPRLALDNTDAIADFIIDYTGLNRG